MKFKRIIALAGLSLVVGACASTRVDFGGTMLPVERPANAVVCDRSNWTAVEKRDPVYPRELMGFLYANQQRTDQRALVLEFDIDEAGTTRNIRLVSPQHYTEHTALRSAILVSAEAIETWRFEHEGGMPGPYAVGCVTEFNFMAAFPQN